MKILFVDDEGGKRTDVVRALCEVEGVDLRDISHAPDALTAKKLLMEEVFDLLIVDIVLPIRSDEAAVPDGGVKLVEELLERPQFKTPEHIIGISAYEEGHSVGTQRLAAHLITSVLYDRTSEEWARALQSRVRHIIASKRADSSGLEYQTLAAVLCALEEPELSAVLRLRWDWEQIDRVGDDTIYHRGRLPLTDGASDPIVAAAAPRMGLPAAAVTATKMIYEFRPRFLVMTGIAAGVEGRANVGDVLVADPSWDWGSGKWEGTTEGPRFLPEPYQLPLHNRVRACLNRLRQDVGWLAETKKKWPGPAPDSEMKISIGPLASGAAVLADNRTLREVVRQHRKLIGIDMESYAVMAAAEGASAPRPISISIKGVSDHADERKNDTFREFAAYASTEVMAKLIEMLAGREGS